jgi:hypothetical protein
MAISDIVLSISYMATSHPGGTEEAQIIAKLGSDFKTKGYSGCQYYCRINFKFHWGSLGTTSISTNTTLSSSRRCSDNCWCTGECSRKHNFLIVPLIINVTPSPCDSNLTLSNAYNEINKWLQNKQINSAFQICNTLKQERPPK